MPSLHVVLYHRVQIEAIGGLICLMLCKTACLFIELSAFQHQQVKLFLSRLLKIICHAWNVLLLHISHHICYPPHSCRFPTVFVTSSFTMLMTAFPAFPRTSSPTPIGRKLGFLSKDTSLIRYLLQVMVYFSGTQFS